MIIIHSYLPNYNLQNLNYYIPWNIGMDILVNH